MMTDEDREMVDWTRAVSGRVNRMASSLEAAPAVPERVIVNQVAAGVLVALGCVMDAVCDELEARG